MNENNENTPPPPVEEWEPLAVIRRLADLYRSNKSDTEVSARAMAMIQEFGARLSRSTPPAERPTACVSPVRNKDACVSNCSENETQTERPTPETDEAWKAVSRTPDGMYDSRVPISAFAFAMAAHSKKMERQLAEATDALKSLHPTGRGTPAEMAADIAEGLQAVRNALAEARELIAVKDRSINAANQTIMLNNELMRQATDKLAEVREQRDRLADALINLKVGLENEQAHGLWDADHIIDGVINPALTIAGFNITADPTLPPGTGKAIDPKTGETLVTIKES